MAKFNLDYYSGENFYSDGDIEKEILKIVKTQGSYESMENVPFPVLYHLSRVRENILNWYPFQEDATCLEIGSGCGAISGLLCEKWPLMPLPSALYPDKAFQQTASDHAG